MTELLKSTQPTRPGGAVAAHLVAQVLFERSHFGRYVHEGEQVTVARLLERLSYRRTSARRRRRGR